MPIYEYRCSSCGFQKEYFRKLSDPLLKLCPECAKETFGKMLSAAGFQLKGSGWYATDFKHSGAKPAAKAGADAKAEAKSDSSGDAKTDAKADTKSDTKSDTKTETASKSETPAVSVPAPAAPASAGPAAK